MKLFGFASVLFVGAAFAACSERAIVIGDDTSTNANAGDNANENANANANAGPSAGDPFVDPDAEPFDAAADDALPLTIPPYEGGLDAEAGDAANDVTCPMLSPPPPGFCDGASPVPKYDSNACIVGYGCPP